MEVSVKFLGGPLDGQTALTDRLDPMKVFFDDRQRLVMVYDRENETLYVYHLPKSAALTQKYDEAKAKIMGQPAPSLRFYDEVSAPEISDDDVFNDTIIPDEGSDDVLP